ncbi:MAG: hypothetical protein ACJATI_004246 [Halioglobus sp.]|jgi:hypothetical protein
MDFRSEIDRAVCEGCLAYVSGIDNVILVVCIRNFTFLKGEILSNMGC